jgi:hypothetical protein
MGEKGEPIKAKPIKFSTKQLELVEGIEPKIWDARTEAAQTGDCVTWLNANIPRGNGSLYFQNVAGVKIFVQTPFGNTSVTWETDVVLGNEDESKHPEKRQQNLRLIIESKKPKQGSVDDAFKRQCIIDCILAYKISLIPCLAVLTDLSTYFIFYWINTHTSTKSKVAVYESTNDFQHGVMFLQQAVLHMETDDEILFPPRICHITLDDDDIQDDGGLPHYTIEQLCAFDSGSEKNLDGFSLSGKSYSSSSGSEA